jgi:hypothetical protein
MVWTDAVQGAARSSGWLPAQALQHRNAPSRPPSRRVRTRIDAGQRCAPCEYEPLFDASRALPAPILVRTHALLLMK